MKRRDFLTAAIALAAAGPVCAFTDAEMPDGLDGGFEIPEELRPRRVQLTNAQRTGAIIVSSESRLLYHITAPQEAIIYPVAVGLAGRTFRGRAYVGEKRMWPYWEPTRNMIRREPDIYGPFAGGVQGGPENPLGARALYLHRNGRDTLYRIHGTSQPWSIGMAGSSGCIRMFNSHVAHLYQNVPVGSPVVAL